MGSETTLPISTLPSTGPWKTRELAPGQRIGRFIVLELLGSGGMGRVHACYDPTLDRRIALKMLLTERAGDETRMLREARAMAKISHPNVVTVHDVGELDGEAYIAMELVDGKDLGRWLEEEAPDRDAILDAFRMAGRGLAAAHDAGLVHRDFKPRNVLVGSDGRARVTDFGLVGPLRESPGPSTSAGSGTETGSVIGTPRYMSPEQLEGEHVDARADQFAFCVALYEALAGAHPFGDDSIDDISGRVRAGTRVRASLEKQLPPRVLAALVRGLARRPADRFAAMHELLHAIAPTRRRWPLVVAAAGVLAVAGVATAASRPLPPDEPCATVDAELDDVWSPAIAQRVRAAFTTTGRPYAKDVFERFATRLDARATEWRAMRTEVCRARHTGTVPSQIDVVRTLCLDHHRTQLRALVEVFGGTLGPEVLDRAVEATSKLPPVASCAETARLLASEPIPEDLAVRQRVEHASVMLDGAEALYWAARYADGAKRIDETTALLQPTDPPATHARAHLLRSRVAAELSDQTRAKSELEAALDAAARANDAALEATIWRDLVFHLGVRLRKPAEARPIERGATLALLRAKEPPRLAADLHATLGAVRLVEEDTRGAEQHYRLALALLERHDITSPQLGHVLNNLGNVHFFRGEQVEAETFYDRAIAAYERALGPIHPLVADVLINTGATKQERKQYGEARARYERALAIWAQLLVDHPRKGVPLLNLGMIALEQRDFAASASYFERARSLFEAHLGRDHEYVSIALTGLGEARLAAGDLDGARRALDDALRIQRAGSPAPGRLGETELAMAKVMWQAGERAAARALAQQAKVRLQSGGDVWRARLEEATAWLAAHAGS